MKRCTLSALLVVTVISFSGAQNNILTLFMNRDFVHKQINCILDRDPCDAIGRQIKGLLPEMMYNNCRRCTPNQAMHAQILIRLMQRQYPDQWNLIERHYASIPPQAPVYQHQ